jgi:hypothetical protein
MKYLHHRWPGTCSFVVVTILSFLVSWFITSFFTRVTWQVPLMEQNYLLFQSIWNHPGFVVWFMLFILSSYMWYSLQFLHKNDVHIIFTSQLFGRWFIFYLYLFTYTGVQYNCLVGGSYFIYCICIYLHKLVSNTIVW